MDFDMFNKMKAEELKNYLRLRGLKVTEKKSILVARAFSAFENNVAVIKTAEEAEAALKQEYNNKLKTSRSIQTHNWMVTRRRRYILLANDTNLLHHTVFNDRQ